MEEKRQKENNQEIYWEWLCSIPGFYYMHREALLRCFDTPENIWQAEDSELEFLKKRGNSWVEKLRQYRNRSEPEKTAHDRAQKGIEFISCEHPQYPMRMKPLPDMPHGLFVRGGLPEEDRKSVALIGARMCTREGKEMARKLAGVTVQCGAQVISGGAYGIDGIAQWEAMECGGASYALLGCGVDCIYPPSNVRLFERLRVNGGLISEFPPGTAPLAAHFPMRNRLISALSDLVVVVEARKKSGSLITAGFAAEHGRSVAAVPGRPGDELSEGCNELIAQGAGLILSPEAFAQEYFPDFQKRKKKCTEKIALAPAEKLVYSSLGLHAKSVWELEEGTSLSLPALGEVLFALEQKGLVQETDRNFYVKVK